MANEITLSLSVRVKNGAMDTSLAFSSQFDQVTLGGGGPGLIAVGTSEENVGLGDIATPSLCLFQSLEAIGGNFVEFGASATTPTMATCCRIYPTQFGLLWLFPTVTIRAKADTASVNLSFWIFEL